MDGLEALKRNRVYRFHPHELRDTFKTWCANRKVRDQTSEFLMGHSIDKYRYNKSPDTPDGVRDIIEEMELVRGELNLLTDRTPRPGLITSEKRELDELRKEVDQLKTPEGLIEILVKSISKVDKKAFAEALKARLELPDKSDDKGVQSGN